MHRLNRHPSDEASGTAPPARSGRSTLKKVGLSTAGMVLLALGAIVVWGVGIEPRLLLDVQRHDAEVLDLPIEWEGETVAMLADFQVGMWLDNDGMVAKAIDRAIELDVTAVLIAGDFVYGTDSGRIDRAMRLVRPLTEAGIPTIAVLGNHDFAMATPDDAKQSKVAEEVERRLVELGVHVLTNESTRIDHPGGGPSLHVVGLGSEWAGNSHPREAFDALAPETARLVLMHNPASFRDLPPHSGSLSLAAHTHGGQVRIPFTPSASWLDIARQQEVIADGWGEQGIGAAGNRLYVNRGIGFSLFPARFRCRPELTVFTLRRAGGEAPARGPDS